LQSSSRGVRWTFLITSLAAFMTTLDVLVVNTALPAIREHMHAGLTDLEWIVNAYTLTFAVLLLPAAALGERFGRRGCSSSASACSPWQARQPRSRPRQARSLPLGRSRAPAVPRFCHYR
jgi:MFS family permease